MSLESQYDTGYSGAQIKALLASVNYPTLVEKLIRYDDDHLLVWDSEDADKAKKIKVSNLIPGNDVHPTGANANLLHNWDFRNPVNQRGLTSTPTLLQNEYTLDRWKLINIGTVAVKSGYITVAGTGGYIPYLRQIVETASVHFAGKTVTFSAYVRGSGRIFIQGSYDETYVNLTSWTLVKTTATLTAERDLYVDIGALDENGSFDVLCAKLELGNTSTLANDPPADYGEELRKCQRYFYRTGVSGFANVAVVFEGNGTVYGMANVRFPVTMRIAPTVTFYSIAGTQGKITKWDTGLDFADISVQTATGAGKDGFGVVEASTALIAGNAYTFHYEASAEL